MSKYKGTKCDYGYIDQQKKFQAVVLLMFIAAGVGLFLIGYLITGTRANVLTVLGILSVLPAAKRVISLVVMVPRRSVSKERYEKMKQLVSDNGVLLTDYVFTSTDKIMSLDFLLVEENQILGIMDGKKQDTEYMANYLQKSADGVASGYQVRLFAAEDEFVSFYKRKHSQTKPGNEAEQATTAAQDKLVHYLKVLAV